MKRLFTTFRYTYTGLRGQILGWGLGLAGLGLMIVSFYETFGAQQETLQQMIASYPPEFLAFFGGDAATMITPAGYLKMYAFSMLPLIIGIFAVMAGSGLIVSDEERGRLDLIVAHPVGRSSLFFGRFLGILGASLSILILGWLGFCVLLGGSGLEFSWAEMSIPFISLFAQTLIYVVIALLLSMFLPSRNLAAMISGAVVAISYFISSLAFMDERLATAAKFMPYDYFQTVLSFEELTLTWLFTLSGISVVMVLVTWVRFVKRDIRLSGEGNWRLPFEFKRKET